MPPQVDADRREREIRHATVRVIAEHGVDGVTIRRVAAALGRSTTFVTHYVADKDDLLEKVVRAELEARKHELMHRVDAASDSIWALLDWSLDSDPDGVWRALVAAAVADVAPVVSASVREFDTWWTTLVLELVRGRLRSGVSERDAADAIGIVVDGLLMSIDSPRWSVEQRQRLMRLVLEPLISEPM